MLLNRDIPFFYYALCLEHLLNYMYVLLFLLSSLTCTLLLQNSLFLVCPYAVDNCTPLSFKSSLTLSIYLFLCFPLLLSPLTCPCSAAFGIIFFLPSFPHVQTM